MFIQTDTVTLTNGDGAADVDDDDAADAASTVAPAFDPNLGEPQAMPNIDNFTLLCGLLTNGFEDMKAMVGQIVTVVASVIDKVEKQGVPDWASEDGKLALFKKRAEAIRAVTGKDLTEQVAMALFASVYGTATQPLPASAVDMTEERVVLQQTTSGVAGPMATLTKPVTPSSLAIVGGPPVSGLAGAFGATLFGLGL